MRITVIPTIRHFPWGAPGRCMGQLVSELLQAGYEVQFFVAPIDLDSDEVRQLAAQGAKVERLPDVERQYVTLRSFRRRLHRITGRAQNLAAVVRKFGPDHVFINQGGTWCSLEEGFNEVLELVPGRYSLLCHSASPQMALAGDKLRAADRLASKARRMFFNSQWTQNVAESQIGRPIPNAGRFQIGVSEKLGLLEWPKPERVARLAMVTRLDCDVKGIDLAVRAVARVNASGPRLQLNIFGDGMDKERLQQLIHDAGADAGVRLMGGIQDVSEVWSDHEMLLMPSRREGLGLAMLEAMSCGRPVLRTPLGGCEEWIEDGVNGFVCPAAEVDSLVETLKRALAERHRWREMGLAAHAKIKRDLDPRPARVFLEALQTQGQCGLASST